MDGRTAKIALVAFAACSGVWALEPLSDIRRYSHAVWRVEEGLPDSFIQSMVQSPDGHLWLGTYAGLLRFDGMQFTLFDNRNTPGMRHSSVSAVCLRRNGALWVGTTGGGVVIYENGRFLPGYSTSNGLPHDNIRSIYEDRAGNVWVTAHGGGLVRISDGRISAYTTKDGLPSDSLRLVFEDSRRTLWVASNEHGLCSLRGGRFRCYTKADGMTSNEVRALHEDPSGRLWVGTRAGGILVFDGTRFRRHPAPPGKPHIAVRTIVGDRDGNLWVGTEGDGLFRLRDGRFTAFSSRDGLPHNFVRCILEDQEGNLWLGMRGGLSRLRDKAATTWTTADGLVNDNVRTVFEDRQGRVWLGTETGASVLEKGTARTVRLSAEWTRDAVRAIAQGRDGTVWLGAETGLFAWREGVVSRIDAGLTPVCAILEDRRGRLWIGGDQGLAVLVNGAFRRYSTTDGLPSGSVNAIAEDREGRLWFGTDEGLAQLTGERFASYTTRDGLPHDHVNALHVDPRNALWVATRGGLARWDARRFAVFTRREGLLSNNLLHVVEDRQGHLWLSSRSEVSRVARADLEALEAGRVSEVHPVGFGVSDGMKSARCNGDAQPAGAITADGRIWFPTVLGASVFDPLRLSDRRKPPKVLLQRVATGSKSYPATGEVTLSPGSDEFVVHFSAISLRAPERVRFRYRLDTHDRAWVDTEQRRTGWYTGIPPGRYRFRVLAYANDGSWPREEAALDIVLRPRFYRTAWFYTLCAAGMAGLAVLAYRMRVAGICRRYEAVLEERARIGREIHDTLMQGVTGISLQLEVALQQLPDAPSEAKSRLDRSLKRLDEVLAEARRCILELRSPLAPDAGLAGPLRQLTEELAAARGMRAQVEVQGRPRQLPEKVAINLLRIAREAVTNSVVHSEAAQLRLVLAFESGRVRMLAADDGRGFDASRVGPSHFGILGMRERAGEIGGSFEIRSAPGAGTEVSVTVPADGSEGSRR